MSFAYRFGYALFAACVISIWSGPALGDGAPPDPGEGNGAVANPLFGPFGPEPNVVDSVGPVANGYRSIHFETSATGFTFPFQVTADNDTIFVGDYSANTVIMYQLTAGGLSYVRSFGSAGSAGGQFSGVAQVAVVGNYIYVADYFNSRVQRFDKTTGAYVSQFGTAGSGTGQFSAPSGLIYNAVNGLLYVSETGNDRVQAFNTSGVYQFSFGTLGSGNGQLNNPFGLAVDSVGNIYVADTSNNRISKFDATGVWLRNIAVGATSPYAVAVDKADNVWVSSGTGDVYAYDNRGNYESKYDGAYGSPTAVADGYFQGVRGIAVTPPLNVAPYFGSPVIIVADGNSQSVQLFSQSVQPIVHPGMDSIAGVGSYSFGIAYDSAENVYVTDYNNNRIYKFDKFGAPITQWGSAGSGNGQFSGLMGIAIDDSDNVYVADRNNNRIQKFTSSGGYVAQWGSAGTGDGQFDHPAGVATDGSWLYVTEENNNRVQKFSLSGSYVRKWGTTGTANGQFSSPEGIAVDRHRNQVYVVEYGNSRIQQFSVFGDFIKVFADSISGSGTLSNPLALATDQGGNVYCSDYGNSRVVQFNDNGTFLGTFPAFSANGLAVDPQNGQIRVGAVSVAAVSRFGAVVGKFDTIGVYRPSTQTFYLRNSLTTGLPDITATVTGGASTDIPIVGDWNGDGIDTPGLWRPSTATFYLWDKWRGLDVATATYQFAFGANGDKPIVGDWDGDGRDGVGVFRPSNTTNYLKNKLVAGSPDYSVNYGLAADRSLGGDWNQDGDYSAGVYRPSTGTFYLTNRNTTGSAPTDTVLKVGGAAGDLPVAGDWTHNGSTGVGFFRAGTFYLLPNNGVPDGTVFRNDFETLVLTTVAFGITGDIPVAGTWGQPPE
jgi:DNA-binding beta-propeller fold protein YncE